MIHYFALDGTYGDATDIIIVHTDDWTNDDWDRIMDAHDIERSSVAQAIAEARRSEPKLILGL